MYENTKTIEILKTAVEMRLNKEVSELVEKMKLELEKKTPEIIASVIVDIMGMAELKSTQDHIVFTIKKKNYE
jgi:actin-like ATPase involved in cell morphogenesis